MLLRKVHRDTSGIFVNNVEDHIGAFLSAKVCDVDMLLPAIVQLTWVAGSLVKLEVIAPSSLEAGHPKKYISLNQICKKSF